MADLEHIEDLLIRYLDGELSGKEKEDLQMRLQTDKALEEQFINLQVAVQAVRQFGTVQQVNSIHTEMMKELKKEQKAPVFSISKAVRYTMGIAAVIFILFIGTKLYLDSQASPDNLYQEAFVDFTVSVTRGFNEPDAQIDKMYQQKRYQSVINSQAGELSSRNILLVGLSYLHLRKPVEAIHHFEKLRAGDNEYKEDAEFYSLLSYIKNKDYTHALPLAEAILKDPSHLYHKQLNENFLPTLKNRLKNDCVKRHYLRIFLHFLIIKETNSSTIPMVKTHCHGKFFTGV